MARNKYDVDEDLTGRFDRRKLVRMLGYLRPHRRRLALVMAFMLCVSFIGLLGPLLLRHVLDVAIPGRQVGAIVAIALAYLAITVAGGAFARVRLRNMAYIGQDVIRSIRKHIFDHLQTLPFAYYDGRPHGKIIVRVVNYVNSLSDLLSNGILNLINDFLSLVFIVCFMLYVDVTLTLICMAGFPPLVAAVMLVKNMQRKRSQRMSAKLSNLNAYIHESIAGMRVTQSFAREGCNAGIFDGLNLTYRKYWMMFVRGQYVMYPIIDLLSNASVVLVYSFGVWGLDAGAAVGGGITVGVLIAILNYVWRFWQPITNIGNFYNQIINAMAYLERIFETIDEEPAVRDLPGASEMPPIKGEVEFRGVTFGYDADSPLVLEDVRFSVGVGESVALVGPTGAGKTTIISLLCRFYDLTGGSVLIDGVDIRSVRLGSLRRQMGVMLQDTFIFTGTVMDNIRYGRLDATDDEVVAAAKAVRAHGFISRMEDGYDTQVNERGSRLSVGQRQLISFARALLADPRILILDEATSSIDTRTELELQEGLASLLKGRTSFIIAHRLSTIKGASRIMFVADRGIVESGSHGELMALRGSYFAMHSAQYGDKKNNG